MRKAICILRCHEGHDHGKVLMIEVERGVKFKVRIEGIPPGKHGFHIHKKGNESCGPDSLCDHFNPTYQPHGGLNEKHSHIGDLGNLVADENGNIKAEFVAYRVRLRGDYSIL